MFIHSLVAFAKLQEGSVTEHACSSTNLHYMYKIATLQGQKYWLPVLECNKPISVQKSVVVGALPSCT